MKPYQIFAVVQKGLEPLAATELTEAGVQHFSPQPGGFALAGHLSTIMRLHLRLRLASRLLVELANFRAGSFKALQAGVAAVDWAPFLCGQRLRVQVHSFGSRLFHESAIAQRIEKIVPHNPRGTVEQRLIVTLRDDICRLSLDASGEHLHKRGWSTWRGEAPLRETVAAAMLRLAGWHQGGTLLADPFCGSGTIPLEACAMRLGRSPHQWRSFAFQSWPVFQADQWHKAINELEAPQAGSFLVQASDVDEEAVAVATHNAETLGVSEYLELHRQEFADYAPAPGTLVVTNPPWGVRLPEQRDALHRLKGLANEGVTVVALLPAPVARRLGGEVGFTTRSGVHDLVAAVWRVN